MGATNHPSWPSDVDEGTVVSNMLTIAAKHDAYKIISVSSFESEGAVMFGAGTPQAGTVVQFKLPAATIDDVLVVRVGSRSDTHENVCIAGSKAGIERLPALAVDDEALPEFGELPNDLHEYLQIEIPMGDAPWL
jgi:hypothetical protein